MAPFEKPLCTSIESSHLFSVAHGNPATTTCSDEMPCFFWPLYFNQLDTKSKDMYRREIIFTGSTA